MPALVIHGLADRMVHVSGGRATAAAIPGAELLLIDGMGHDLPRALFETFPDAIRRRRTARQPARPAEQLARRGLPLRRSASDSLGRWTNVAASGLNVT